MGLIFPKKSDLIVRGVLLMVGLGAAATAGGVFLLTHPETLEPGYQPKQPVPYSHKLHAGNLGMDCLYCHNTVDKSSYAAVPATQTCMNCHSKVKAQDMVLAPVRESWEQDKPIPWIKIHRLPDYVYFNHSAHVNSGVSCVSCHGRVDQMVEVKQVETLAMSWCLDCHRNPAARLRPAELVTKLDWKPERDPAEIGKEIIAQKKINPPVNCSGCHR
jgi:menaquinone reductase, multiheme cytochrome c subunit